MANDLDLDILLELADEGDPTVQSIVGATYYRGIGFVQDYAQALRWLSRAAEQGDADAQFNLCCMYGQGLGVAQDYVQAHKWANLAAARADKDVSVSYAEMREALACAMTLDQVAEAQRLAREWTPRPER